MREETAGEINPIKYKIANDMNPSDDGAGSLLLATAKIPAERFAARKTFFGQVESAVLRLAQAEQHTEDKTQQAPKATDDYVQGKAHGADSATPSPHRSPATDSLERVLAQTIATLQSVGFGMLAKTDVEQTMNRMPDRESRSYRIVAASNPPLQHRAPTAEPSIVMLLPNNVFVREEVDGHITVGLLTPVAVLRLNGNPANGEIVQGVRGRLVQACDKLAVS
jgi:uncharacterized protein (DUF302 family)/ElaB/YqjD/DUF883 family membrane-anchored ribosome-binding protein